MNNLDCSIESIRFITETVTYYMEKRLFPDQLIDHRYFQVDVTQLPTIRSKLSKMSPMRFKPRTSGVGNKSDIADKLWFDSSDR